MFVKDIISLSNSHNFNFKIFLSLPHLIVVKYCHIFPKMCFLLSIFKCLLPQHRVLFHHFWMTPTDIQLVPLSTARNTPNSLCKITTYLPASSYICIMHRPKWTPQCSLNIYSLSFCTSTWCIFLSIGFYNQHLYINLPLWTSWTHFLPQIIF